MKMLAGFHLPNEGDDDGAKRSENAGRVFDHTRGDDDAGGDVDCVVSDVIAGDAGGTPEVGGRENPEE